MPKPEAPDDNFFKPQGPIMRGEIRVITLVMAGWLLTIMGSQVIVYLLEYSRQGAFLSRWTFFNLPIPFWLIGQFLPLWFILLCVVFNIWMDRHDARGQSQALRFRVHSGGTREE